MEKAIVNQTTGVASEAALGKLRRVWKRVECVLWVFPSAWMPSGLNRREVTKRRRGFSILHAGKKPERITRRRCYCDLLPDGEGKTHLLAFPRVSPFKIPGCNVHREVKSPPIG